MEYLSHNIAVNLKRIRTSKGMSLDVVSEQTGVSKSMLAQIEKERANPSIGVLGKIISGLRMKFEDLIQTPPMEACIVNVGELTPIKEMKNQYRVYTCFPYADNFMIEIYHIELEPGGVYYSGGHGERTREYVSVIEGELTMKIANHSYVVYKENVFRFESDQAHQYINQTEEKVSLRTFFVAY